MNVAIPVLNNRVAPCFEAASVIALVEVDGKKIRSEKYIQCEAKEGFRRIRLLRLYNVDVLICNGIKSFYRDLLSSIGVRVVADAIGTVAEVLEEFLGDRISPKEPELPGQVQTHGVNLNDLISWSRAHFENNGFEVKKGPGLDSFLIDLVAERSCPLCAKKIRVAICCGVHTYSTELEIEEFNYCAKSEYNARVFIYPGDEKIAQKCHAFGIEHLVPFGEQTIKDSPEDIIPVLKLPVEGHPDLPVSKQAYE